MHALVTVAFCSFEHYPVSGNRGYWLCLHYDTYNHVFYFISVPFLALPPLRLLMVNILPQN